MERPLLKFNITAAITKHPAQMARELPLGSIENRTMGNAPRETALRSCHIESCHKAIHDATLCCTVIPWSGTRYQTALCHTTPDAIESNIRGAIVKRVSLMRSFTTTITKHLAQVTGELPLGNTANPTVNGQEEEEEESNYLLGTGRGEGGSFRQPRAGSEPAAKTSAQHGELRHNQTDMRRAGGGGTGSTSKATATVRGSVDRTWCHQPAGISKLSPATIWTVVQPSSSPQPSLNGHEGCILASPGFTAPRWDARGLALLIMRIVLAPRRVQRIPAYASVCNPLAPTWK